MKIKAPPQKSKAIYFRVSPEEHEMFTAAAWAKSMLLSQWIRAVLLQKLGLEPKV